MGFGVGWMDHDVPFHASASVAEPTWVRSVPTAVQAPGAGHDTPSKEFSVAPVGLGVGWMGKKFNDAVAHKMAAAH